MYVTDPSMLMYLFYIKKKPVNLIYHCWIGVFILVMFTPLIFGLLPPQSQDPGYATDTNLNEKLHKANSNLDIANVMKGNILDKMRFLLRIAI